MGALKGDFIGFTFNNVPSSDLGIIRTDNGGRFTESLLPAAQDKTVQVPGGDGTYFFGSYYTQKDFSISFAFDSITEAQLRKIKEVFGDKKPHELIFDETPYKIYLAKVTGLATINYICFDDGPTHRLYKGEGSVQFIAYQPYATCKNKFLEYYIEKDEKGNPVDKYGEKINYGVTEESISAGKLKEVPIKNRIEWAEASGLLQSQGNFDKVQKNQIELYNPGDTSSDWILTLKTNKKTVPAMKIWVDNLGLELDAMEPLLNPYAEKPTEDEYIRINTKTNLIEGYFEDNGVLKRTGNLYNNYLIAGDFFKIPKNSFDNEGNIIQKKMIFNSLEDLTANLSYNNNCPLEYNYYYF